MKRYWYGRSSKLTQLMRISIFEYRSIECEIHNLRPFRIVPCVMVFRVRIKEKRAVEMISQGSLDECTVSTVRKYQCGTNQVGCITCMNNGFVNMCLTHRYIYWFIVHWTLHKACIQPALPSVSYDVHTIGTFSNTLLQTALRLSNVCRTNKPMISHNLAAQIIPFPQRNI